LIRLIFSFIPTVLCCCSLYAQHRFDKWGVVSPADLAITVYAADSAASAVILHDVGTTWIEYNERKWYVTHTHFRRIKIFDPATFDQSYLNIIIRAGRPGEGVV